MEVRPRKFAHTPDLISYAAMLREKWPLTETGPWLIAGRLGSTILPHEECGFSLLYNATLLLRDVKMQSDNSLLLP